jgi:hypothetical protein
MLWELPAETSSPKFILTTVHGTHCSEASCGDFFWSPTGISNPRGDETVLPGPLLLANLLVSALRRLTCCPCFVQLSFLFLSGLVRLHHSHEKIDKQKNGGSSLRKEPPSSLPG